MAIAGVAAGLLLTFVLDRGTGSAPFQHLYYLPIIFAAFTLNWGGGLAASLCAIVLYHLANPALLAFGYHEPDFVQMTLFVAVGVVTSTLTANARRLHAMAMTDDLTGLHNLRSFEGELRRLIHAMRSSAGPMSLMVLDLDRLKSLNDTHGHLTGAEAVRSVGHILGSHLPADAVACRYGGDEFVVALPAQIGGRCPRDRRGALSRCQRERSDSGRQTVLRWDALDQRGCGASKVDRGVPRSTNRRARRRVALPCR